REVAGVTVGVLDQVILVLGLGLPERAGGLDRGDGLTRPQSGGVDVGDRVAGDALLLGGEREDRGAITGADVVSLPVQRGRVVDLEEEREDVPVRRLGRVEDDLHRFGVAGVVAVGGVRVIASGVFDARGQDAGVPGYKV